MVALLGVMIGAPRAEGQGSPLTLEQVEALVRGRTVSAQQIVALVTPRCRSFALDAPARTRLRNAGATSTLLDRLSRVCERLPTSGEGPGAKGRATAPGNTEAADAAREALKSDLRSAATAQELFFAEYGRYASRFAALGVAPAPGNSLVVARSGPRGYTVLGMSPKGHQCYLYSGDRGESVQDNDALLFIRTIEQGVLANLPRAAADSAIRANEDRPVCASAQGSIPPPSGAPDISTMTPRERSDRLYNRVMSLVDRGESDSATFWAPMAVAAYQMVDSLDADARYHYGRVAQVAGELAIAEAQRDTILRASPNHLLGLLLSIHLARRRLDGALERRLLAQFRASRQSELARALSE